MESLFFELKQVLQNLNDKLQQMLEATLQHNQALRHNDMMAIKTALQQLDVIARQSKAIDGKREQLQRELEHQLGLKPGTTIGETINFAPDHLKKGLSDQAHELKQTTEQIKQTVELNKILTQKAMQFNETLLNVLRPTQATYCAGGQGNVKADTPSLLNKTV